MFIDRYKTYDMKICYNMYMFKTYDDAYDHYRLGSFTSISYKFVDR